MISAFDLFLLGTLVSLGGLMFLFRAYRSQSTRLPIQIAANAIKTGADGLHEIRQRAETMAGVRWLTVGALALFVGYTRGSDSGYLFDLWSDLAFHTALLSCCWAATVFRIKRVSRNATAGITPATPTAPDSRITPQGIAG
jgi:hypothetical protein